MAITSFSFLCFCAALFLLYYLTPKKVQWVLLLAASIFYFLTAGSWLLILYPLAAITIVYFGALYIDRVKEQRKKKFVLSLVVVFCLLTLIMLKYVNFGVYTYNAFLLRLHPSGKLLSELHLLAPVGISFYTLALMGYLFDVYYGIGGAQKNYLKFMLFGMYFPVIVSGPIVRYRDMEAQLYSGHRFDYRQFTFGLQRILWGFFKKLVIAERMAVIVNAVYADYGTYRGMYVFLAAVCFAFQLYTDFSGGMDIVIGLSEALGIKVAENFSTPYFAKSIQEFWRRWHITLGAWMKDYLFYPMLRTQCFARLQERCKKRFGKRAGKKVVTFLAMFILWFAVGMWHGGAWKFIIGSGLLHWGYIVLGESLETVIKRVKGLLRITDRTKWFRCWQQLRTFLLVCAGFVFFRADSFSEGCALYRSMFSTFNPQILFNGEILNLGLDRVECVIAAVSLALLLFVSVLQQKKPVRERLEEKNIVFRWLVLYVLLFYVILFGYYGPGYSAAEFIYKGF